MNSDATNREVLTNNTQQMYNINGVQPNFPSSQSPYPQQSPTPKPNFVIKMPPTITQQHPYYALIVKQCSKPCPHCAYHGGDIVRMSPGCTAAWWAFGLFCLTGLLCFWIPLVVDSCKDVVILCNRCLKTKFIIKKPCC